tara:strand:- start:7 stop:147 length:141 start_codon:yes stop_codon:yes gene_type:complete
MTPDVALVSDFVCFNLNADFSNAANAVKTILAFCWGCGQKRHSYLL